MKKIKKFINDETGQGAAEYILLFGGVIAIAIAALLIYKSYFENSGTNLNATSDINDIRGKFNSTG